MGLEFVDGSSLSDEEISGGVTEGSEEDFSWGTGEGVGDKEGEGEGDGAGEGVFW